MSTEITVRLVASVWLVQGLYNTLLGGSARHLAIVQSVPGLASPIDVERPMPHAGQVPA